jgi:hypothetical protein
MHTELYKKVEEYIGFSFPESAMTVRHLQRTADWVKTLRPSADEALCIAALAHDLERSDTNRKDWGVDFMTNPEFLKYHQERGADIAAAFLKDQNVPTDFVQRVWDLIAHHEVGGTADENLLKDADSISFFENNVDHFLKNYVPKLGSEKVQEKFAWMFDRITSPEAQEYARPLYERALEKLRL